MLSKQELKIVYMGTPDFAVATLDTLLYNGYNVCAVVTSPDKPSGRGLKLNISPIKKYSLEKGLKILQPANLKSSEFNDELRAINPHLQIVVAFRMLPESVWKLASLGTFNLHASLLPQYRGAAPINWAIINGETETGVTTFFINEHIDTGHIIKAEKVHINPDETAGELHDKLMRIGASLVVSTVDDIIENNIKPVVQETSLQSTPAKSAPKIFKDDCRINWNNSAERVYNHIRGLSPYPAAFTDFISPDGLKYFTKLFSCKKEIISHNLNAGQIITDSKTRLSIAVTDGFIHLLEIQVASKRKMLIDEFLRGFPINNEWKTSLA